MPTKLTGALRHGKAHRQAVRRAEWRVRWKPPYDVAMILPQSGLDPAIIDNLAMVRRQMDEICGIRVNMGHPGGGGAR